MLRETFSRFEPGRQTLRSCIPCNRALPRVPLNRESNPLSLVMTFAFVFVLGLCLVTPALPQSTGDPAIDLSTIPGGTPPINATGFAIGTLCPKLSPQSIGATGDLQRRCTEMVGVGIQGVTSVPQQADSESTSSGLVIQDSLPRDQPGEFRERAKCQYRCASRRPTWRGNGHKPSRVVL